MNNVGAYLLFGRTFAVLIINLLNLAYLTKIGYEREMEP